jgi:hypothetical protein
MDRCSSRTHQGWLLERSAQGTAFLSRGFGTPVTGTKIFIALADPQEGLAATEEALVKRVCAVHTDLFLVATQNKPVEERPH